MTDTMTPGRALAQWWAEQLGAQPFSSMGDGLTDLLLMAARPRGGPLTEEQTTKFVEFLAAWIDERLVKSPDFGVMLSTDYGPEGALVEAGEHAGIPLSRFPIKTHTSAYPDFVVAALGYGSNTALVWSREGWDRPACNSQHYVTEAGNRGRFLPERCGMPRFHGDEPHGAWVPITDEEASAR